MQTLQDAVSKVKQAFESVDVKDPALLDDIRRLCIACTNDDTR